VVEGGGVDWGGSLELLVLGGSVVEGEGETSVDEGVWVDEEQSNPRPSRQSWEGELVGSDDDDVGSEDDGVGSEDDGVGSEDDGGGVDDGPESDDDGVEDSWESEDCGELVGDEGVEGEVVGGWVSDEEGG
jgi:hypothetical protein